MSEDPLSVVVTCGERAVCHAVDPRVPAGELVREIALYLGPLAVPRTVPFWRTSEGSHPLDPTIPIGVQVPADAEIDLRPLQP